MIKSLVIPYFAYEIIYYLLYVLVLDKSTGLYLARPQIHPLVSHGAVRLAASRSPWCEGSPSICPLPFSEDFSSALRSFGNFLSIPRIVYFFPFFLAGMEFDSSCLTNSAPGKAMPASVIGAFTIFLFTDKSHLVCPIRFFTEDTPTQIWSLAQQRGVLIRLICYGISFLLVYMFMLVLPSEKKPYSYLGQRTMAIYIFHGIIYSCLKYRTTILASVQSNFEVLLLIAFCIGLVFVLASRPALWRSQTKLQI